MSTGTTTDDFFNLAYRFINSHAFNTSNKTGFYCYNDALLNENIYPNLLTETTIMELKRIRVIEYNKTEGVTDYDENDKLSTVVLKPIVVEIDNPQDFCVPNKWNDDQLVRNKFHFPYLQVLKA